MPPTSYDRVPYESGAIRTAHVDRLHCAARLFRMSPAPVTRCRVLEIGCAEGGNLVPMAHALPGSEFVGIDLSARQIESGRAVVRALGLANLRLEAGSVEAVDASWGQFDYVICHGVYSWVPARVREAILALCRRHLTRQGVAYVSYNTYPGWHTRDVTRGLMRFHVVGIDEPRKQIEQARAVVELLCERLPDSAVHRSLLRDELEILERASDAYVFHEHLEEVNEPCYFHAFAARAAAAGLQYLGDATLASMASANLEPELAAFVDHLGGDILAQEQYMDFVRNRPFRCSLLCHEETRLERSLEPGALEALLLRSAARATGGEVDLEPGRAASFDSPTGADFETSTPLTKAAFSVLGERYPTALSFGELRAAAESRLRESAVSRDAAPAEARHELGADLLRCVFAGAVQLQSWQPMVAASVSERPRASRLAAFELALGRRKVTNAFHEMIALDAAQAELLPRLDGTRDARSLGDAGETLQQLAAAALLEA